MIKMEIENTNIYNILGLQSCYDLAKKKPQYLKLGCLLLNEQMSGIKQGFLTEICGDAGTGKSIFSVQILLNSILDEQAKKIKYKGIYISTQKPLHKDKWNKISQNFASKHGLKQQAIYKQVIMRHLTSVHEFRDFIQNTLLNSQELEQGIIKTMVIDNIHALCQEFSDNIFERSKFLKELANQFKDLQSRYGIAIIVTNNMTANIKKGHGQILDAKIHQSKPALGLLWSNIINERFLLRYMSSFEMIALQDDIKYDQVKKRRITVLLSPRLALKEISFYIDDEGIKGTKQW